MSSLRVLATAILFILVGCAAPFKDGLTAYRAGQTAEAKKQLSLVKASHPDYAKARFYLGLIAHKEGDAKTSLTMLGEAFRLDSRLESTEVGCRD